MAKTQTRTPVLTKQGMFDVAWQKFIVEERPRAWVKDHEAGICRCVYQTPRGERCAVGWSFPDDSPLLRSAKGFAEILRDHPEMFEPEIFKDRRFTGSFQFWLHDEFTNEVWEHKRHVKATYEEFAQMTGLFIPGRTYTHVVYPGDLLSRPICGKRVTTAAQHLYYPDLEDSRHPCPFCQVMERRWKTLSNADRRKMQELLLKRAPGWGIDETPHRFRIYSRDSVGDIYETVAGRRVIIHEVRLFNSASAEVTFPVKGTIITREKKGRLPERREFTIWTLDGRADVMKPTMRDLRLRQ